MRRTLHAAALALVALAEGELSVAGVVNRIARRQVHMPPKSQPPGGNGGSAGGGRAAGNPSRRTWACGQNSMCTLSETGRTWQARMRPA